MKQLLSLIGALLLGVSLSVACTYPTQQVKQVEERPLIVVEGAPEGARLLVDGIDAGLASHFSGEEAALRVLPGRHVIEVVDGGRSLYRKEVFVGSASTKVIRVSGGAE
jgi:hypothetical protein